MGTQSIGGKPQATGLFLRLAMFLGLFLSFGVATAFAASSYTVTEASATVGTATTLEIEYTLDAALDQGWADNDTLDIVLPANFPAWSALTFTAEYDTEANNDATNETAIAAGVIPGTYQVNPDGDNTRELRVYWNQTGWGLEADGSTIRILVTADAVPQYEDATSTFTFAGTTVAADTNPSGTDDVDVNPADAAGGLGLGANAVVGTDGDTTLTLTLPLDLAATDTITFTAPANLDVNSVAHGSNTFAGAGSFACADAGQVVTCTADGAITAGTATIVMSGIVSEYVADAGNIADLTVNNVAGGGGADFATDAVVVVTATTVGDLTSTNVEPASLIVGRESVNTVTFTTSAAIPSGGIIKVTYPSGWNVANMNGLTAGSLSGLDGTWTASVSGQIITLTQSGGTESAAGAKSLTLSRIVNTTTPGNGGTYAITTTTSTPANIETAAAVTTDVILSGTANVEDPDLDAVSGIEITKVATGIEITWTESTGDESTHVDILRGKNNNPVSGTSYAVVAEELESYIDTDVAVGDTVKYILRPTNGRGDYGDLSEEFTITVSADGEIEVVSEEVDESVVEDIAEETAENVAEEAAGEESVVEETASEFTDISGHWGAERIAAMANAGIVKGDPNGEFRPDDSLNRAEAAALLHRVLGMEEAATPGEKPFSDVEVGTWYAGYVDVLKGLELVNGNPDGTYKPAANINRAEFLHLALNVYYYMADDDVKAMIDGVRAETTNPFVDVSGDAYYVSTVRVAHQMEFVEGVDCTGGKCFNPASDITRAEATKILYEMFFAL